MSLVLTATTPQPNDSGHLSLGLGVRLWALLGLVGPRSRPQHGQFAARLALNRRSEASQRPPAPGAPWLIGTPWCGRRPALSLRLIRAAVAKASSLQRLPAAPSPDPSIKDSPCPSPLPPVVCQGLGVRVTTNV